jgi:hypothetical protein
MLVQRFIDSPEKPPEILRVKLAIPLQGHEVAFDVEQVAAQVLHRWVSSRGTEACGC